MDLKTFETEELPLFLKIEKIKKFVEDNKITAIELWGVYPFLLDIVDESRNKSKYESVLQINKERTITRSFVLVKNKINVNPSKNLITQNLNWIDPKIQINTIESNKSSFNIAISELKKFLFEFKNMGKSPVKIMNKGLYIHGKPGIGKSYFLKAVANLLATKDKKVAFVNVATLLEFLKYNKNKDENYQLITNLKRITFLFLDDIGGETVTEWFRDDVLFSILDHRSENLLTTFFSSIYSINELKNFQTRSSFNNVLEPNKAKRLIDRVRFLAKPVEIKGKNLWV